MSASLYCPHCGAPNPRMAGKSYHFTCSACGCITTIFNGHIAFPDGPKTEPNPKVIVAKEKKVMTLVTLTSPLAIRLVDGTTQLSNVFEAEQVTVTNIPVGFVRLHIYKVFNSKTQEMITLNISVRITVKESNIRSRQEVL